MAAFFKNQYVQDILHMGLTVAPFLILQIPTSISSLTLGGLLALGLAWIKSKVPTTGWTATVPVQ